MIGTVPGVVARPPQTAEEREAARLKAVEERLKAIYGHWDGAHCAYLYTNECLANWPGIPTFKGDSK